MRFTKLNNPNKLVFVNINKYQINWDESCVSKFQTEIKQWLKPFWFNHLCYEELVIPGSLLRVDLLNLTKKIIVESSGVQHIEYNEHFHRGSKFNWLSQMKRDVAKRKWAEINNFKFVEIYPDDLPLTKEWFLNKYEIIL